MRVCQLSVVVLFRPFRFWAAPLFQDSLFGVALELRCHFRAPCSPVGPGSLLFEHLFCISYLVCFLSGSQVQGYSGENCFLVSGISVVLQFIF